MTLNERIRIYYEEKQIERTLRADAAIRRGQGVSDEEGGFPIVKDTWVRVVLTLVATTAIGKTVGSLTAPLPLPDVARAMIVALGLIASVELADVIWSRRLRRKNAGRVERRSREEEREALRRLSRTERYEIEDQLLLPAELDTRYRTRFSAGRMSIFVLAIVYWGLLMVAISGWSGWRVYGPLTLIPFFGSFVAAFLFAERTWKLIGMRGRFFVRLGLHYWPLLIYIGALTAMAFRR